MQLGEDMESSDSETEDEFGDALTPDLDLQILRSVIFEMGK